jgi:ABC-type transport system involved in multi-copper enzyme maturation permease subunit
MSSVPQTTGQQMPSPVRRDTVVMGRSDFFSVVLRLIGVELYKIRRRTMSKVLSTIGILIMIISFVVASLIALIAANTPASSFLPPPCTASNTGAGQPCLNHAPTQAELALAEQEKHDRVAEYSSPLRLPDALGIANQIIQSLGLVLIVILAGTIVGGEYSGSTIRLMFTRGPTRTQFLLSKIGAILACIILGVVIGMAIGIITGAILNIFTGISTNLSFFSALWLMHAIIFLLEVMLALFMYAMLSLCLSTLGRATAAGVAGSLVWWVLESVLGGAFYLAGAQMKGFMGDFLRAVPDYFIGNNISALLQNQASNIYGTATPSQLSDLHAVLVLAGYLVIFIGLAWWITRGRDITN